MNLAERVRIREIRTLSDDWYVLKKTTFDYRRRDGSWQTQSRQTYDRGNGATLLLYDPDRRTVVLTRQFRFPAFVNGCRELLIETPGRPARRRLAGGARPGRDRGGDGLSGARGAPGV